MYLQSTILLCGIVSPWLATATIQSAHSHAVAETPSTSIGNNVPLRILPLGDSITWGYGSSAGNGYRLDLLNLLSHNSVQYIGSQRSGNMTNNYNEGHPGAVITQIEGYAKNSLNEQPNLVLLMAGTADVNALGESSTAPESLGNLIDEVVTVCPTAVVLVAELPPIRNAASEARAVSFNAAVLDIVSARASAGKHVLSVNMGAYVTADDLEDGVHPTDHGYSQIAQAWFDGIEDAASKGWIVPPRRVRKELRRRQASTTCTPTSTSTSGNNQVQGSATGSTTDTSTSSSPTGTGLTTTLTSTLKTTSTVTVITATVHPTSTSTTSSSVSSTTSTSTLTPSTSLAPTLTTSAITTSFPSNATSLLFASTSPSSLVSASVLSTAPVSTSASSSTPIPPVTGDASGFKGNLSWMAAGLAIFWLSVTEL